MVTYYLISMAVNEGALFKSWDTGDEAPSKGTFLEMCFCNNRSFPV